MASTVTAAPPLHPDLPIPPGGFLRDHPTRNALGASA